MNSRKTTNDSAVRSLENSISVYSDYKEAVKTGHMTEELKQAKIQELDNQISECEKAIERLREKQ